MGQYIFFISIRIIRDLARILFEKNFVGALRPTNNDVGKSKEKKKKTFITLRWKKVTKTEK